MYFIAILTEGAEPVALRAADREQVRLRYPDAALVAPTTLAELLGAGWSEGDVEDVEGGLYGAEDPATGADLEREMDLWDGWRQGYQQ